jgi:hypothetical protein
VASATKTTGSPTSSTAPTAGGRTPSSAVDQVEPYDPIAC